MQDRVRQEILKGFLLVLRPIARILLRFGIGYKEFDEVAKAAFVDVASSDFGIRGRPTNISRVAVMTGLTRKEVRRIRDEMAEGDDLVVVRTTPMLRLLHNWCTSNEFLDPSGRPAVLPFVDGNASFSSLVRSTGGDIPPGALRTELKRVGAAKEHDDGSLELVQRTFIPEDAHENLIETLVHFVYPVMSTVAHNTNPERKDDSWPNKTAFSPRVRKSEAPRLRRIAADKIDSLAIAMDDIFASYETLREGDETAKEDTGSVYVGAFYYEGPAEEQYKGVNSIDEA